MIRWVGSFTGGVVELKQRIVELARAAGIDFAEAAGIDPDAERISPDRCWVDGHVKCPYGSPEGQYVLRPESFCHDQWGQGDGCAVFHRCVEIPELPEQHRNDAVREYFEAQKTDVTGELRARAEELPDNSPEQMALRLAADIIEERHLDRNILLEEDLPA